MTTSAAAATSAEIDMEALEELSEQEYAAAKKKAIYRLLAVVFLLVSLYIVGVATGLDEYMTVENVRDVVAGSGWWGIAIFVGVYFVGNLIQIPSNVFNWAGVIAFGLEKAIPICYVVNTASIFFSFYLVRTVGGQPMKLIRNARVRKLFDKIDTRPKSVIFFLRTFMGGQPALTYALAMSPVKGRDHFIGTVLGMPIPVAVMCTVFHFAIDIQWPW